MALPVGHGGRHAQPRLDLSKLWHPVDIYMVSPELIMNMNWIDRVFFTHPILYSDIQCYVCPNLWILCGQTPELFSLYCDEHKFFFALAAYFAEQLCDCAFQR